MPLVFRHAELTCICQPNPCRQGAPAIETLNDPLHREPSCAVRADMKLLPILYYSVL